MSRKTSLILIILAVAALSLGPAIRAAAQGEDFTETFDNPQLPGWERSPEVIVKDGGLLISPAHFAARMGSWQDFALNVRLRASGTGETHINYQASDSGSYLLAFAPDCTRLLRLEEGRGETELASQEMQPLQAGSWVELAITASAGQHIITVDGTDMLSASDPNPLPAGAIMFSAHGEQRLEVNDLRLQSSPAAPGIGAAATAAPTLAPAASSPGQTSWEALLAEISSTRGSTFELGTFTVNLLLAVVSSFILSRVYVYWGGSLSNRRKFAANFMLITITTTFIILVVRSSVALSLGLVGALSIIRFRAAIKEPEELAYLFFAISLGIGLGDNQRLITLMTLAVVVAIIGLARLLRQSQADVNLHLAVSSRGPEKVDLQQVMDVLEKHASKLRLLRFDEKADALEMSFVVEFAHLPNLIRTRSELQSLSPGLEVSFLDNRGVW